MAHKIPKIIISILLAISIAICPIATVRASAVVAVDDLFVSWTIAIINGSDINSDMPDSNGQGFSACASDN